MQKGLKLHFFFKEGFVYCRIYSLGKPAEFSTGVKLDSGQWSSEHDKVIEKGKGRHPEASSLNERLDSVRSEIKGIYEDFNYRYKNHKAIYSSLDIKQTYLGATTGQKTLLAVFLAHNKKLEATIGLQGGYSASTIKNYYTRLDNVAIFIKEVYKKPDIALLEIKKDFADKMRDYMQTERLKDGKMVKFSMEYISRHLEAVNRVMNFAMSHEYIPRNPLQGITLPGTNYMAREILYFEEEELQQLESYQFPADTLQRVADCTIFAAHTGLAYFEQYNLKPENIIKGIDGGEWLSVVRHKTKRFKPLPVRIPLDSKALEILSKYAHDAYCRLKGLMLPVFANAVYNRNLKEIAALLNIDKQPTTHTGRKTFGMLLLNNGVPPATVAAMMGDSMAVVEKHYARIIERTIARDMEAYQKRKNAQNAG